MATIIGTGLESYLHRQARERALNIIAEAKEEARRLLEHAEQEAAATREQISARTRKTAEERRRRAVAQAQLRAKQIAVRRQEELVQQLWRDAETRLRALEGQERLSAIERLLADAAAQLGGGPLQVQVNAADQALLRSEVIHDWGRRLQETYGVESLVLNENPAPIWGGVIVRRTDASQLVDNSFNERLALVKRQLRDNVFHILTPQQETIETPERV